jgi:hypothetical protein
LGVRLNGASAINVIKLSKALSLLWGNRVSDSLKHSQLTDYAGGKLRNQVTDVELREVTGTRQVPLELFEKMRWLFG